MRLRGGSSKAAKYLRPDDQANVFIIKSGAVMTKFDTVSDATFAYVFDISSICSRR